MGLGTEVQALMEVHRTQIVKSHVSKLAAVSVVSVLLVGSCVAKAQELPDGWTVYPNATAGSEALRCAGYSKREWKVTLDDNAVKVDRLLGRPRTLDPMPLALIPDDATPTGADRHVIKVNDGWLVGFDAGEWGGGLWWFSEDGKGQKKLGNENVVGFTQDTARILALTGLSHMGLDFGKVLRIEKNTGSWSAQLLVDLGEAPRTFVTESRQSVLVVTTKRLLRVNLTGDVQELLAHQYLFLYPTSMTLSTNGMIHIGMRHFITRLTPVGATYEQEWLVPADCRQFELQDGDCVCSPPKTARPAQEPPSP